MYPHPQSNVNNHKNKGKGKVHPRTGHEGPKESTRIAILFFNLGARWRMWSGQRPGRFIPKNDTIPITQDAGWAPDSVWAGTENLARTGIRSPDLPARRESLY